MKDRKKFIPLKVQLIIKINLLIMLIIGITSYFSFRNSSKILLEDSIQYTQQLLTDTINNGEQYLDYTNVLCSLILYDSRVLNFLQNNTPTDNTAELLYVKEKFNSILLSNSELSAVGFYNGVFHLHDKSMGKISKYINTYRYSIRSSALSGKGKPVYMRLPQFEHYIVMARVVYDKEFSDSSSIILVFISVEKFKKLLKLQLREYREYLGLHDFSANKDIFTPEIPQFNALTYTMNHQMKVEPFSSYTLKEKDLISFRTFNKFNWSLYLYIPLEEIYKRTDALKISYFIIGIISIILSSILATIIASGIARPIQDLVEGIKKIDNTPQFTQLKVYKNDEMGYLSKSFNAMSLKLDNLINQVYQKELTEKEVEFKALQAQINPHFLFNVLESISWMARMKGADDASDMINALSDILHVRMGKSSSSLIPITDELEYLNNYIFLQQFRFDNNLIVEMFIDERIKSFLVPALILQPLVENSIHHNNLSDNSVTIKVYGGFEDEYINLTVTDNGSGFNQEELLSIRVSIDKISKNDLTLSDKIMEKIGIENVARRIFLSFGSESLFSISSIPCKETKIEIKIPMESSLDQEDNHV